MSQPKRLSHQELARLSIRVERRILTDLTQALQRARAGLKLGELERALLLRNLDAAVEAIGLEPVLNALAGIETNTQELRTAGFDSAVLDLPKALQRLPAIEVSMAAYFGQRPDVRKAVDAAGGDRIVQIAKQTKEGIRGALKRGLDRGVPPRELAKRIRPMIGLTDYQAQVVDNYRQRLEDDGRPAIEVERATERYATKQLRLRAETIARTESIAALNLGKRTQWERLVDQQIIEPGDWEQEWVTAADERTCPICEPLHGETAPVGGTFPGGFDGPPAHPRCRCITRLQLAGFGAERPVNRFRPFNNR